MFFNSRKTIIHSVLATDMAVHFELTSKFTSFVESAREFKINDFDDRMLITSVLLHAADISNVSKPYTMSKRWSDRVFEEFLNQVQYLFFHLTYRETWRDNMVFLYLHLWIVSTQTRRRWRLTSLVITFRDLQQITCAHLSLPPWQNSLQDWMSS